MTPSLLSSAFSISFSTSAGLIVGNARRSTSTSLWKMTLPLIANTSVNAGHFSSLFYGWLLPLSLSLCVCVCVCVCTYVSKGVNICKCMSRICEEASLKSSKTSIRPSLFSSNVSNANLLSVKLKSNPLRHGYRTASSWSMLFVTNAWPTINSESNQCAFLFF